MAKKREKLTLVQFTAAGYGGYTGNQKTTNAITVNVFVLGYKNIEERVEKERITLENRFRQVHPGPQFEMRVKSKIKNSFYIDYFLMEDNPIPAKSQGNHDNPDNPDNTASITHNL